MKKLLLLLALSALTAHAYAQSQMTFMVCTLQFREESNDYIGKPIAKTVNATLLLVAGGFNSFIAKTSNDPFDIVMVKSRRDVEDFKDFTDDTRVSVESNTVVEDWKYQMNLTIDRLSGNLIFIQRSTYRKSTIMKVAEGSCDPVSKKF